MLTLQESKYDNANNEHVRKLRPLVPTFFRHLLIPMWTNSR